MVRAELARNFEPSLLDGLQFFAGFEANRFPGRDIYFRAGAGIAPNSSLPGADSEHTKAAKFDAIASGKRLLHAFKDGLDRHFGLGFGDASLGDNFVNQIQFDHKWLRKVLFPGTAQPELWCDSTRPWAIPLSLSLCWS